MTHFKTKHKNTVWGFCFPPRAVLRNAVIFFGILNNFDWLNGLNVFLNFQAVFFGSGTKNFNHFKKFFTLFNSGYQ